MVFKDEGDVEAVFILREISLAMTICFIMFQLRRKKRNVKLERAKGEEQI